MNAWREFDTYPLLRAMKRGETRYTTEGQQSFNLCDALMLHCMLRHLRPRRVIEVGSGLSSAMMLDTNERFLDNRIACTFIDPYPDVLRKYLRPGDEAAHCVRAEPLQDVPTEIFAALEMDDVLFIDSSHVLKTDSDVSHILFRILPALRPGVVVHVHDIFYPFEYPEEWIMQGWFWNEAYALRAILQHSPRYEVLLFVSQLALQKPHLLRAILPKDGNIGGGSFWMRIRDSIHSV